MADTVMVRPRRGLILAGIPRQGAAIDRALAEEWIADQLVERVPDSPVVIKAAKPTRKAPRATKRRRTSGR